MAVILKGKPLAAHTEFDAMFAPTVKTAKANIVTSTQQHVSGQPIEPKKQKHVHGPVMSGDRMIKFGAGQTINLGDFESIKIYVEIDAPCTKENQEAVYDEITSWVGDKLNEAVGAAKTA